MNSLAGGMGPTGSLRGSETSMLRNKIPKGYREGRIAQYTPEQMGLFRQSFGQVGPDSYLSRLAGGDEELFNEIEAPALRQFAGLQGQLASRFSQPFQGASSARNSSGFQNAMRQQASDFALDLQGQRQSLQRQAIKDLMGLSESLLGQRPYENFLTKKKQKTSWAETIGKLGGAIPGLISSWGGGGSSGDALKGAFSIFGG